MGKLLKRLKVPKTEKKKVSLFISEEILKRMEELRGKVGNITKSEFVERLLEYSLSELERELKKENKEEK